MFWCSQGAIGNPTLFWGMVMLQSPRWFPWKGHFFRVQKGPQVLGDGLMFYWWNLANLTVKHWHRTRRLDLSCFIMFYQLGHWDWLHYIRPWCGCVWKWATPHVSMVCHICSMFFLCNYFFHVFPHIPVINIKSYYQMAVCQKIIPL